VIVSTILLDPSGSILRLEGSRLSGRETSIDTLVPVFGLSDFLFFAFEALLSNQILCEVSKLFFLQVHNLQFVV